MMTRKFRLFLFFTIILFSFTMQTLSAAQTQNNWVIAAQKFTFTRNQTGSVADGISTMFPARILEKLSSSLYRTVGTDEAATRELFKIKQERNSLFLQLSSEVKKRDSLVLKNYNANELAQQIAKENEKINEIKKKLNDNLTRQEELNSDMNLYQQVQSNKNESTTKAFFKSLFFETEKEPEQEKVSLYKNDISALYSDTSNSSDFETQLVNAKINCLLTGQITAYDEYMSVTVTATVYPGKKQIAVVTEIGSVEDADLIASIIASQLAPAITNSMPCVLVINLQNEEEMSSLNLYIDDVLYTDISNEITIDAGVHFIQFTCPGYKNLGTNYYFEGDKRYAIDLFMEQIQTKTIYISPVSLYEGNIIANGINSTKLQDNASRLTINGNTVLAQFITQENGNSFIYISPDKIVDNALYNVKLKPVNHTDYIEKQRRQMYLSYSILVTSLIPTIITKGIVQSYRTMLGDTSKMQSIQNVNEKLTTANSWVLASRICTGVSIACGVWFVFELYRYFNSANSVLPANTKITFDYVPAEEVEATVKAAPEEAAPAEASSTETTEAGTTVTAETQTPATETTSTLSTSEN